MTIYPTTSSREKPIWIVDYSALGKQKRKSFPRNPNVPKDQDPGYIEASKYGNTITKKVFSEGPSMAQLPAARRVALLGLNLKLEALKISIAEAERIIVASLQSREPSPVVPIVMNLCLNSKKARIGMGISERYVKQLTSVFTQFSKAFRETPIDQIDASDIETWIQFGEYTASSRKSRLTDVRTLFSFAKERKYIKENPCDDIPAIMVSRKTPGILSPRQAAKLMRVAYNRDREICPWLALSLFCGIRPEELNRIKRSDVMLDKKIVHISEEASKTGNARNVDIPDNAVEWLRLHGELASVRPDNDNKMKLQGPPNIRKRFDYLRKVAGLYERWPHDAMRHSSVTYLYALTEDEGYVAKQHGHGIRVLLVHYNATKTPSGELVTREMAKEYFSILPTPFLRLVDPSVAA